jgi:hypothetical protein
VGRSEATQRSDLEKVEAIQDKLSFTRMADDTRHGSKEKGSIGRHCLVNSNGRRDILFKSSCPEVLRMTKGVQSLTKGVQKGEPIFLLEMKQGSSKQKGPERSIRLFEASGRCCVPSSALQ